MRDRNSNTIYKTTALLTTVRIMNAWPKNKSFECVTFTHLNALSYIKALPFSHFCKSECVTLNAWPQIWMRDLYQTPAVLTAECVTPSECVTGHSFRFAYFRFCCVFTIFVFFYLVFAIDFVCVRYFIFWMRDQHNIVFAIFVCFHLVW